MTTERMKREQLEFTRRAFARSAGWAIVVACIVGPVWWWHVNTVENAAEIVEDVVDGSDLASGSGTIPAVVYEPVLSDSDTGEDTAPAGSGADAGMSP